MDESTKTAGETINSFIERLSAVTGYKYLKSRELKKTVGPVVFEILFYSSKWNWPGSVEIETEMRVSYKKYGAVSTVDSVIASKAFQPADKYYYDISDEEKADKVFRLLEAEFKDTVVDLSSRFEKDFDSACQYLLDEKFYDYNVELDFLEDTLGTDKIMYRIKEMTEALSDSERQQIADYHNGARNKNWMLNRGNMRYIADKGYV